MSSDRRGFECLCPLRATIPRLSRPARYRHFQRHGTGRLPLSGEDGELPKRRNPKTTPPAVYPSILQAHPEEGKRYLFVAIDRTSKVAFAGLYPRVTKLLAAEFMRRVLAALPCEGHRVPTGSGTRFGNGPYQMWALRHIFDRVCDEYGTGGRFTEPARPWTNGQGERMNRTH